MSINKRVFGAPITGSVRDELERRQNQGEIQFGDSLDSSKLNQYHELSSRTPFVRMWTSLKLIQPADMEKAQRTTLDKNQIENLGGIEKAIAQYEKKGVTDPFGTEYTSPIITTEIDADTGDVTKLVILEENAREKIDFARKIYIIGNHEYQKSYGEVTENQSLTNPNTGEAVTNTAVNNIFPQELKNNNLLKPQSGITSLSVETQGAVGEIKKTIVKFLVHNFNDFDRIFNKYFLKPGATIFVDYGWSTVKDLYDPKDLIESINKKGGTETFLYGNTDDKGDNDNGVITKNQSNLDVIQGIVQDFNAKILPNGTVDCEVTLISSNSTLLNKTPDSGFGNRMISMLRQGVYYYTVTEYLKDILGGVTSGPQYEELQKFLSTPTSITNKTDTDSYNESLENKALLLFKNSGLPSKSSVGSGIFIPSLSEGKDVYITWGLFEDVILNSQFGFGKNKTDVNKGNNFQVRMDSSNSFTTWNEDKSKYQAHQLNQKEKPDWLYPKWWEDGKYDDESGNSIDGKSYSFKEGKTPIRRDALLDTVATNDVVDQSKSRIPIREIFINVALFISIFQKYDDTANIRKIINKILKKLSDDELNIFQWEIAAGDVDSQIKIIDKKFDDSFQKTITEDEDLDKLFFTFNIMSKNSFVKDYNLEMKIPEGDMAAQYALQGLSHDSSMVKVKKEHVDKLKTQYHLNTDQLSILYEPDTGDYNARQNLAENNDTEAFNVYDSVNQLTLSPIDETDINEPVNTKPIPKPKPLQFSTGAIDGDEIEILYSDNTSEFISFEALRAYTNGAPTTWQPKMPVNVPAPAPPIKINIVELDKIIQANEKEEKLSKRTHAMSIINYFNYELNGKIATAENEVSYFPYYLTLTIHGISSIQPGDTFRVDYLPKEHLNNSYLQTMQVRQELSPSGWFTTLETQYRNIFRAAKPNQAPSANDKKEPLIVRLSSRALTNKLQYGYFYMKGSFYSNLGTTKMPNKFTYQYLLPFMKNIEIESDSLEALGVEQSSGYYILKFTTPAAKDSDKFKFAHDELNKIKGIFLQPLYAEFAYKDNNDEIKYDEKLYQKEIKTFKTADYMQHSYVKNNDAIKRDGILGSPGINNKLTDNGGDPHTLNCKYAPFNFCDPKYYSKNIGNGLTYGRTGTKDFDINKKTRIYPPAVAFVPDTKYKMLYSQTTNQYAIFRELNDIPKIDTWVGFSSKDINKMIIFFAKIGTKIKNRN